MESLSTTPQARPTVGPANQVGTGNDAQRTRERDASFDERSTFEFSLAAVQTLHIERAASALNVYGTTPQDAQPVATPDTRDQSGSAQSQANQNASDTAQQQSTRSPERQTTGTPQPLGASSYSHPQNNVFASFPQAQVPASAHNNAGSFVGAYTVASDTAVRSTQAAAITPTSLSARENAAVNRSNAPSSAQIKAPVRETNFASLVASRLNSGETRFEVRLDPPELGRIDVRLVADARQSASLSLTFEHQSTRDLFRQDEQALRDLLKEHGFEVGSHDLSFDLDQRSHARHINDRETPNASSPYREVTSLPIDAPISDSAAYISPHHAAANAHLLNITA